MVNSEMPSPAYRGRWLGAALLGVAAGMLIGGQTMLKTHLAGIAFLLYWLGCMLLTGGAILVALRDLRAQGRVAREAHRELLESALKEIQASARAKRQASSSKPSAQKSSRNDSKASG